MTSPAFASKLKAVISLLFGVIVPTPTARGSGETLEKSTEAKPGKPLPGNEGGGATVGPSVTATTDKSSPGLTTVPCSAGEILEHPIVEYYHNRETRNHE
jgi:hypothetical protein